MFYPSIPENSKKSISFAKQYYHIFDKDIRIVDHCRKSLLFKENELWRKKETESYLDLIVSSYERDKIYKLTRNYILSCLATIISKSDCGLYRDDCWLIPRKINV